MQGVKEILEEIETAMDDKPSYAEGVNAVFQFDLSGDEAGTYQVGLSDEGENFIAEGEKEKADCVLQMDSEDFIKMANGELNGTQAFMTGKLKIKGNMGLALKLQSILAAYNKEKN